MRMRFLVTTLLFALLGATVTADASGRVLVTIRSKQQAPKTSSEEVLESYSVRVSTNVANARQFIINTPSGTVVAQRRSTSRSSANYKQGGRLGRVSATTGRTVFSGSQHSSEYVISMDDGRTRRRNFHGIFNGLDDRAFVVRRSRGRMVLDVVRKDKLPSCGGAIQKTSSNFSVNDHSDHRHADLTLARDVRAADTTVVDIAVFYSAEAFAAVGNNVTAMTNEANSAVALANQGYLQSGIDLSLNLVHVSQQGSELGQGYDTVLTRVIEPNDGFYDNLQEIRLNVKADVAVFMMADGEFCGLAPLLVSDTDPSFAPQAFATVNRLCISNFSFMHEVAHLMGAHHDILNAGGPTVYPYSYGHRFRGISNQQFRTAMAYAPGTRINFFSNPNLTFDGRALGTSTANNARTVNNTKNFVATFSQLIVPTPTPTVTPTPTATETPSNEATATPTPKGGGGSASSPSTPTPLPPPPTGTVLKFTKIKAKKSNDKCDVSSTIVNGETPVDGTMVQLVVKGSNKVIGTKTAKGGKVKFAPKLSKVGGNKLKLVVTNSGSSKSFQCK